MVDLGRQQKDFGVLELYKTRAMGSFPEMRYEETEVWTKDATGNPVSSISDLDVLVQGFLPVLVLRGLRQALPICRVALLLWAWRGKA